jgi:hypothetical protein
MGSVLPEARPIEANECLKSCSLKSGNPASQRTAFQIRLIPWKWLVPVEAGNT